MRDTLLIFCLNSIIVSLFHCFSLTSLFALLPLSSNYFHHISLSVTAYGFFVVHYFLSFLFLLAYYSLLFFLHFPSFLADFLAFSLSLTIIVISLSHSLSCSRFFVFIRVIKYPSSLYICNYSQYSLFPHSLYSLITLFPCLFATFLHSTTRLSLSTY